MVLTKKNILMTSAAIAIAFNFSSCKKDNDSQTDKLVGEWEMVERNGYSVGASNIFTTFIFEADKDFGYCSEYTGYDRNCFIGEWEWTNDNETTIDIQLNLGFGYPVPFVLEIESLTNDELVGDINFGGYPTPYVFQKIK